MFRNRSKCSLVFRQNKVIQEPCTLFGHGVMLHVPVRMFTGFVRLVSFPGKDIPPHLKVGVVPSGHISDRKTGAGFNAPQHHAAQLTIPGSSFFVGRILFHIHRLLVGFEHSINCCFRHLHHFSQLGTGQSRIFQAFVHNIFSSFEFHLTLFLNAIHYFDQISYRCSL